MSNLHNLSNRMQNYPFSSRMQSYVQRLPTVTLLISGLCVGLYFATILGVPVVGWFSLDPSSISRSQLHRLNTYPLVHLGLLHVLMNLLAFVPLGERFEREHGSLKMGALALGPLVTFPAILYLVVEMWVLRGTTAVLGLSCFVMTLFTIEAVKTSAIKPHISILGRNIPTAVTPLLSTLVILLIAPESSFLGHLCGVAIGYLYGYHYLHKLDPPDWVLVKIEGKLSSWGILRRLQGYVSMEAREEMMYAWLPTTREREERGMEEGGSGGTVHGGGFAMNPGPSHAAGARSDHFAGVGRTLGS